MPSLTVSLGLAALTGATTTPPSIRAAWQPTGGWTVDRALVLAFARQELGFNPRAHSPRHAL